MRVRSSASAGETIQINRRVVTVNGKPIEEPYTVHTDLADYSGTTQPEPFRSRDSFGPYVVPPDHYFILGDNRDSSMDSRYHGAVGRPLLTGKVVQARGERGVKDLP